ncbi:MAG TPA: sigma-70 family RNA polymerase sigma factor [Candidatus Limnocylindria bacterium]|nr:sigma-70 family RNA polymerase sigma factor [Candidatus Limnocylindria bacterium]
MEFARTRDEAAFSELVSRYVDLVHSTSFRVTADPHLAEDVSQSVFLALAAQCSEIARRVERGMPLSAWLHTASRNRGANVVRGEVRRRAREQEAIGMHETKPEEVPWERIAPILDHALGELSEGDRQILLLRYFEHKTAGEIASRLGLAEAAAQKRLGRALEKLRIRFATRGVLASGTTFATAITAHGVQAAPIAFTSTLSNLVLASGATATVAAGTTTVFSGLISSLLMTKSQIMTVCGVIAVLSVPLAIQQARLNRARYLAPTAVLTAGEADPLSVSVEATGGAAPLESEADELARLRAEAARLQVQLAARRSAANTTPGPAQASALVVGRRVPADALTYIGTETPAASVQTYFSIVRSGSVQELLGISLIPPDKYQEVSGRFASEDFQREIGPQLAKSFGSIQEIELLEEREISPRRRSLSVRLYKEEGVETNSFDLGLTSQGWMHFNL